MAQSPLARVADDLDTIASDPQAVEGLRQSILDLQAHENPVAREAGELWGAALGALAELREADGDEAVAEYFQLAVELFSGGLDAWLEFGGVAARDTAGEISPRKDPMYRDVLEQLASACDAGRRAMDGDAGAQRLVDKHLAAARRSVKALRSEQLS